MKYSIIIAAFLISTVQHVQAQTSNLFSKTWKVKQYNSTYHANSFTFYHKDSANNTLDLSAMSYSFGTDGKYYTTSNAGADSVTGVWSVNAAGDSITLDNHRYLITELTASSFITRSYSLQIVDASGTLDTVYAFIKMYNVSPLPVTLTSFTGKYADKSMLLSWSTAQEINNREFEVQYSNNGTDFTTIGNVPGKGTTHQTSHYSYATHSFKNGKNFYRLKQIDLDGRENLSAIVAVTVGETAKAGISFRPNPASSQITFSFDQLLGDKLQLVLTSVAGRQVWNTSIGGGPGERTLYLPSLAKGIYIVSLINEEGENIYLQKLIIQ